MASPSARRGRGGGGAGGGGEEEEEEEEEEECFGLASYIYYLKDIYCRMCLQTK
jgi:hypothetical protein